MTRRSLIALVALAGLVAVCTLGGRSLGGPTPSPSPFTSTPTPTATPISTCPSDPLMGVYHPSRLVVQRKCMEVTGVVTAVRHEEDGDYHIDVMADQSGFTNAENDQWQHGALVTEIMPGQTFPIPTVAERVDLLGTWVLDTSHGWEEIHPVFSINGVRSLPVVPPEFD
jgi:hypothetical protein